MFCCIIMQFSLSVSNLLMYMWHCSLSISHHDTCMLCQLLFSEWTYMETGLIRIVSRLVLLLLAVQTIYWYGHYNMRSAIFKDNTMYMIDRATSIIYCVLYPWNHVYYLIVVSNMYNTLHFTLYNTLYNAGNQWLPVLYSVLYSVKLCRLETSLLMHFPRILSMFPPLSKLHAL